MFSLHLDGDARGLFAIYNFDYNILQFRCSDIADKFGHKVIGLEKINVKLGQEREKYGKSTKEKQEDSTTTQQKIIKNQDEQPVEKEFNRVKTHFDNDANHEQKVCRNHEINEEFETIFTLQFLRLRNILFQTNAILNNEVKTHDDEFSQRVGLCCFIQFYICQHYYYFSE